MTIENCTIRYLTSGIHFLGSGTSKLAMSNTLVSDNDSDGIVIQSAASNTVLTAVLNRVEIYNNGVDGLYVSGTGYPGFVNVTVTDSNTANNKFSGIDVRSNPGQTPAQSPAS